MSEVTTANINAASEALNDVDFNKEVGKDFKAFKDWLKQHYHKNIN